MRQRHDKRWRHWQWQRWHGSDAADSESGGDPCGNSFESECDVQMHLLHCDANGADCRRLPAGDVICSRARTSDLGNPGATLYDYAGACSLEKDTPHASCMNLCENQDVAAAPSIPASAWTTPTPTSEH